MKRLALLTTLAIAMALIAGCAGAMSPEEIVEHSRELGDSPPDYQDLIQKWAQDGLKDPYSAHYDFQEPVAWKEPAAAGGEIYGWLCNVDINAKNGFGGYIGKRTWGFFIHDDQIVTVFPPYEESSPP